MFAKNISCLPWKSLFLDGRYKLISNLDWSFTIYQNGFKTCNQHWNKKDSYKNINFLEKHDWENENQYGPIIKCHTLKRTENKKVNQAVKTSSNKSQSIKHYNSDLAIEDNETNKIKMVKKSFDSNKSKETVSKDLEPGELEKNFVKSNEREILPGSNCFDYPLVLEKTVNSLEETEYHLKLAKNILSSDGKPIYNENYKPSVTHILQKTMSAESASILERWRLKMIESLGVEGFAKYQQDTFRRGSLLHEAVKKYLNKEEISIDSQIDGFWKSIYTVIPDVTDKVALEEKISHPYLSYCGVFDCVAKYRNQKMLIEWKTSEKQKPSLKHTYDNTLQVAAYIGAYNCLQQHVSEQVDGGLIVIAYADGSPAHAHVMSRTVCEDAWKLWLIRLKQYSQLKASLISQ